MPNSTTNMLFKLKSNASSVISQEETQDSPVVRPTAAPAAPAPELDKPEQVMKNLMEACLAPTMGKPKPSPSS